LGRDGVADNYPKGEYLRTELLEGKKELMMKNIYKIDRKQEGSK
jgi:hypothetical protein